MNDDDKENGGDDAFDPTKLSRSQKSREFLPPVSPFEDMRVRNLHMETLLNELAQLLRERCAEVHVGFSLLLFNFGPGGSVFYSSNGNRDDVIATMKEFIAHQEREGKLSPNPPKHQPHQKQ